MSLPWVFAVGFGSAMVLSVLFTAVLRRAAPAMRLVDDPDGRRKMHADPMPVAGGVAIFAAVASVLVVGLLLGPSGVAIPPEHRTEALTLAAGTSLIFLLGLADDLRHLGPWTKVIVQVGVAVGVFTAGTRITQIELASASFTLPVWVGLLVTVLWLVGITNSFNLIDGSDGVAGGAAFFAFVTFALVAFIVGKGEVATVGLVFAGATLGFLLFNFPPASIYLGDAGSQLLGFSLAALAIVATQKTSTVVAIAVPILSFGVPILDTSLAIVRRAVRRRPIFQPDRGHIHHRLAELGYSPRMVAVGIWMLCALFGALALTIVGGTTTRVSAGMAAAGVVVLVVIQRLRLPEVARVSSKLPGVDRGLEARMPIARMAARIRRAGSGDEIAAALSRGFGGGQFAEIELRLHGDLGRALRHTAEAVELPGELRWRADFGADDWAWESRFPILGESGGPRGIFILRHADGFQGSRMDLGRIQHDLMPALVWTLEQVVAHLPRLNEPPPIPASLRSGRDEG